MERKGTVTMTLDQDVISRLKIDKGRYSVSGYVNDLLDRHLKPLNYEQQLNK